MHLYTVLDGRSAANPVKDVPAYDESASQKIRAYDPRLLYRIIARIGRSRWKTRRKDHRGKKRRVSRTRARLRLMLWTGWPPAQLMRIDVERDVNWKTESVWIDPRRKGKGGEGRRIPLLVPAAVAALKHAIACGAVGKTFSTASMHKSMRNAVILENAWRARFERSPIVGVNPYSLRHTFGTELAKRVKDERVIQELMLLRSPRMVRRYTEAATSERLEAARQVVRADEWLSGAKVAARMTEVARREKSA